MIKTGRYYVMYNDISYVDEHNISTGEIIRYNTGWTTSDFDGAGNGTIKLLGMTLDYDYIYVLYSSTKWLKGSYRISKFNHSFEFIETYKVNYPEVTSVATDNNYIYLAYRDFDGFRRVSRVGGTFIPTNNVKCNINKIFGYNGKLYGFETGTIKGIFYEINTDTSTLTRIKINTQKNGPDYGAQRNKFYGYSYPGYLEYDLLTGNTRELSFVPKYDNYVLGTLATSNGLVNVNETITISEKMFMSRKGIVTYPAVGTGTLHEVHPEAVYNNFGPSEDLYTEG